MSLGFVVIAHLKGSSYERSSVDSPPLGERILQVQANVWDACDESIQQNFHFHTPAGADVKKIVSVVLCMQ